MAGEEANRMSELYFGFKKELKSHPRSLYYDEDDLIDIFDYAGDVHDDHIRLEALMLGFKLFPESTDLIKRRAIFLSDINDLSFGQFIVTYNNVMPEDFMWEILRCRAFATASDIQSRLVSLLDKFRLEEDEEIIQFVNLVHQFGQEQWMLDNLDWISERCSYPSNLKYEIARSAESPEQMKNGIELLNNLTEEDPFNTDYWGLLADIQSATEQYEEALNSLEYAKALNPEDADLYSLQGYVELQLDRPEKAVKSLEKAVTLNPESSTIERNLIQAYKLTGESEKMKPLVKRAFERDISDSALFTEMLVLFPDEFEATLEAFHASPSDHDEVSTMQRIGELCSVDHADTAFKYLEWYRSRYEISIGVKFAMLELIYMNGDYEAAYKFLDSNFGELTLKQTEFPYIGLIASVLIKSKHVSEAYMFIDLWIGKLKQVEKTTYISTILTNGLIDSLSRMKDILESNVPLDSPVIDQITV